MRKEALFSYCVFAAGLAVAMPSITLSEIVQFAPNKVVVRYALAESPALVTATFETNYVNGAEKVWVPLAKGVVRTLVGDVDRVVYPGHREFTWKARTDWPGHTLAAGEIRAKIVARSLCDPPDFAIIDLEKTNNAVSYCESVDEIPGGVGDDVYKTTKLLLRRMRAANVRWCMGANYNDAKWIKRKEINESPHMVSISEDYYIGVYEFTQRQYEIVAGYEGSTVPNATPSETKVLPNAGMRPVTNVGADILRGSGEDYIWPQKGHDVSPTRCFGLLRARYGFQFDLPTAAQWEFAYRAGTSTSFFLGRDYTTDEEAFALMSDYAWTLGNTTNDIDGVDYSDQKRVHVVGKKLPNPWGLYDIAGNALEVCLDWAVCADNRPSLAETVDPVGPLSKSEAEANMYSQIWRGGSCVSGGMMGTVDSLRASAAYTWKGTNRSMGFRICCPAIAH